MQYVCCATSLQSTIRFMSHVSGKYCYCRADQTGICRLRACRIPRCHRCGRSCRCRACASSSALRASAVCCACCALLCQVSMPGTLLLLLEDTVNMVCWHICGVTTPSCVDLDCASA